MDGIEAESRIIYLYEHPKNHRISIISIQTLHKLHHYYEIKPNKIFKLPINATLHSIFEAVSYPTLALLILQA